MYFRVCHETLTNKNLEITNCLQENQTFRYYTSTNRQLLQVVVVVVYPIPSEGWGRGGRPWSPRSRATPQGLDQRS